MAERTLTQVLGTCLIISSLVAGCSTSGSVDNSTSPQQSGTPSRPCDNTPIDTSFDNDVARLLGFPIVEFKSSDGSSALRDKMQELGYIEGLTSSSQGMFDRGEYDYKPVGFYILPSANVQPKAGEPDTFIAKGKLPFTNARATKLGGGLTLLVYGGESTAKADVDEVYQRVVDEKQQSVAGVRVSEMKPVTGELHEYNDALTAALGKIAFTSGGDGVRITQRRLGLSIIHNGQKDDTSSVKPVVSLKDRSGTTLEIDLEVRGSTCVLDEARRILGAVLTKG
jgi:hypothetical protein